MRTESPHNAVFKGRERPAFVHCFRDGWKLLQFKTTLLSDFCLTGSRGSLKLTVWWGRPDGMRKDAVSGTQLVISPQIRQFQGGDGQLGPAGLRAHILETPALYHRSICTCIMGKCKRLRRDCLPEVLPWWGGGGRVSDIKPGEARKCLGSLRVKRYAGMISLHRPGVSWCIPVHKVHWNAQNDEENLWCESILQFFTFSTCSKTVIYELKNLKIKDKLMRI